MATITPIQSGVAGTLVTPVAPTASDTIPASAYNYVDLVFQSTTGTPTMTIDDPTSANPSGTLVQAGNFDVTVALTAGQTKVVRLDCARFRDPNGNINIITSTPANSTVFAIGRL
jgi:hypothetical protein